MRLRHYGWRIVVGIGLSVVAMEAGLRLVEVTPLWRVLPVAQVSLYGPDPDTGYTLRPGVRGIWATENRVRIEINEFGMRDGPTTLDKPPGTYRVALLGDSRAEALQVELDQTFQAVAERRLAASEPRRPVEILNFGLAGASPAVQLVRLTAYAKRFSPDAAIFFTQVYDFTSLDLGRDGEYPGYVVDNSGNARLSFAFRESSGYQFRRSWVGGILYMLLANSRVALILNERKNIGLFAELRAVQAGAAHDAPTGCTGNEVTRVIALWDGTSSEPAAARLATFLTALSGLARDDGLRIVLALRGIHVGCAGEDAARARLAAAVSARTAAHGLEFVDMDAALEQRAGPGWFRQFSGFGLTRGSGHLNPAGHVATGEVIAEIIAMRRSSERALEQNAVVAAAVGVDEGAAHAADFAKTAAGKTAE